ncbi:hypothetical protein OCU04_003588 [Sclerotinia nivalis]|uniref:C3H1-type domain-containing protein n=1 Tax=Sclerotinia nivalis TaxID=352851 RepID=A0A9X0DMV5_9HELO|nr:hypothetical protein OCU04_003588 [Sclerotinia nivalis]
MAICVYYLVGRCLAGTKCYNKHTGPACPTPCRNFVLHGTCTWGSSCRFAHPAPVASEDPKPSRPPCKNFLSRRGCKFGSKCLQYHPGAMRKESSSSSPAPPSPQSTTTTPTASETTDIANIKLSQDKSASTMSAPSMESSSTPDLPLPQSTMTTPAGSKVTDTADVKSSDVKVIDTMLASSMDPSSIDVASSPSTGSKATDTTDIKSSDVKIVDTMLASSMDSSSIDATSSSSISSKATDTADVKSSDVKIVDTMLASSMDPSSSDAASSPPAQASLSTDMSKVDATYTRYSNDELDGKKPAPSMNPNSNPTPPPSQLLTSVSTHFSNTDETSEPSLKDIMSVGDSYELVRSPTRSLSPVDSEYDTSLSTVPEEASTTPKLVQSDSGIALADSMNNNNLFNILANQSTAPLTTTPNDSSTDLGLAFVVQSADLDLLPNQLPSFTDEVTHVHSPNDTMLSTVTEDISITPLITAPVNSYVKPKPASAVECTNPDLPPNKPFDQLIAASAADKQHLEILPISTNDQTIINKLSPLVIDCSAAAVSSNLELEGPGIYGRQICHSVILCTWPQEWNIPAVAMVETLTNLASTFGEIVCPPFYRNAGFSHSLQFTFQHPHEAAAASAQLNGQYINAAGTYMSVQVLVTHQITVTYMIPQYIIDSLGRHGQGNLHTLFEQNFCQLQWNNFHRYDLSGELTTEVTVMGMFEEQVAQCKAVLEDLIRGRVLTHEEGDNRPLWHNFFNTEEGTKWLKETTKDAFYLRVRAARMANLNVLMIYGSSEWTRNEFGGIIKKKITELVEEDEKAAAISAVVAEELRLMRLRIDGWRF